VELLSVGKGKYKKKAIQEELLQAARPSSLQMASSREDGASGALETRLLPMLSMGQKGWRPRHSHPASYRGQLGVGCCGHLPWACTRSTPVFLVMEAPGRRATQRNEETHPAQPPPLISHPSSILLPHPPFPSTAPLPPPAVPT